MTEPGGTSEGASWIDVAASGVGIEASMRTIGERASRSLTDSMKAGLAARGAALGDELLAGMDKSSQASMIGAAINDAIGKGIGAPLALVRRSFEGLTRDGTASVDALRTEFNQLEQAINRSADSLKAMQAESRASASSSNGGVYDATKILAASDALDELKKRQADVGDQLRATEESARSAGEGFSFAGIQAGIMGGAIGVGATLGIESFDELISKATELGEKLLDAGETQELINRQLQASTAATGEQLENLSSTINSVAANTSASFSTITSATALLSTRLVGLAGPALESVATKIADAGQLLGRPLDVGALTASMRALGVNANDAGHYVDMLFNVSRATGQQMPELVEQLGSNAAVLSAFGLNADQSARLLAGLSEAGIKDSSVLRGLNPLVKEAEKAHESLGSRLKEVVQHIQDAHDSWLKLHDQADLDTEDYWASKLGTRGAIAFKQAIDDGKLSVASLSSALGDIPTDGVDDVYNRTLTLSDRLSILKNQVDSDLGPLGEVLQHSLEDALSRIGTWISSNTPVIVSMVKEIGVVAIEVGGTIAGALANLTGMIGSLEAAYGLLTGNDATRAAGEHLQDLGSKMADLGDSTDKAVKSFEDLMDKAQKSATISQDLKTALKTGADGTLQLGDPASVDALRKAGVDLEDRDGKITVGVDTEDAQKEVRDLLATIPSAKDLSITVTPRVEPPVPAPGSAPPPSAPATPPPPASPPDDDSFDWLNPLGIGENSQGFDVLDPWGIFQNRDDDFRNRQAAQPPGTGGRPHPSAHGSGYEQSLPTTLDIQPAAFKQTVSTVLDAAGVPDRLTSPDGITLPTMPSVRNARGLDSDGLMAKAGVPDALAGSLPDGTGEGVVLPTAFDSSKPGPTMSVGSLMESVGIPEANQGDTGVTLDVSYNSSQGGPASIPAGFGAGGAPGGGTPTGGGGPVTSDGTTAGNAKAIIAAGQARGFNADQIAAILSTGLQESGLSESARGGNGAWHGVFQQDSSYPNRDDAAGNIQGFYDRLGAPSSDIWAQIFKLQQGTPYGAPNARNAYMGEIKSHYGQAQQMYQQYASSASSAGGGAAPAPGSGDGSYAGVTAGDTASTASPQHGGIPSAPSGVGEELLSYMKTVMDQFNQSTGRHLAITADYPGGPHGHPDDGADHSVHRALDIAGSQSDMDAFVQMIAGDPGLLAATRQLIHDDPANPGIGGLNVIGGHTTSGAQTYGSDFPEHQDHDHRALQYAPGQSGPTGPAVQNAGYSVTDGSGPTVIDASRTTGSGGSSNPGDPQVAAPTAPGSSYQQIAPPPGMTPVPDGTPNAVPVPGYGSYLYSWDLPADEQSKLRPEQKEKRDEWIQKAQDLMERQQSTAQQIQDLQQELADAKAAKDNADALPDDPADPDAKKRADQHYDDVSKRLTDALQQQTRELTQSRIDAEKPPPYEKDEKGSNGDDGTGEQFGKGIVKGVFQEFGIDGSVFKGTKAPNEWGLTKILGGVLSFGLNLSAAKRDNSAGGDSTGTGSDDGGLLGMIENAVPALKALLHPTGPAGQSVTANAPGAPDAPALPAGTPASGQGTGPAPGPTDPAAAPPTTPPGPAPSAPTPSAPAPRSAPPAPSSAPAPRPPPSAPAIPSLLPGDHVPNRTVAPPLAPGLNIPGVTVAPSPSSVVLPPAATSGGPPATHPDVWNPGAPPPPSTTPAAVGATPPPQTIPAGYTGPSTTTNNGLTVNVTNQGFSPTPQVADTIRTISVSTSAPAMSGGAGIPL